MKRGAMMMGAAMLLGSTWLFAQNPPAAPPPAAPVVATPTVVPAALAYKIDANKSVVYAIVLKDGVASAVAHDHVITAKDISGTIQFLAGDSKNSIDVTVKVDTMVADDPAMRKKAGLGEGPSGDDARTVEQNMKAADQLNVAKYPTMSFKSTSITSKGGNNYEVAGKFTLHGTTRDVKFSATAAIENNAWHGKAKFTVKQSDYGYQPYSALFGAIKNQDPVTIHLDLWANPAGS